MFYSDPPAPDNYPIPSTTTNRLASLSDSGRLSVVWRPTVPLFPATWLVSGHRPMARVRPPRPPKPVRSDAPPTRASPAEYSESARAIRSQNISSSALVIILQYQATPHQKSGWCQGQCRHLYHDPHKPGQTE